MKNPVPNIISKTSSQEEIQFLEDRLYEHNTGSTSHDDGELFSKLIYDSENRIIAGLTGWTWAGACEVTALWVDVDFRNRGYGRILLRAAEDEAKQKNCKTILLRTYNFQSPYFYQKHNYKMAYIINDFPPGYSYYCMIKHLSG